MEIARWERKLAYEKYKEDGKTRGFWGSQYGDFIARYFPAKVGLDMTQPPAYFDVWSEADRRQYDNYEMHLYGRCNQHRLFWAGVGFFGFGVFPGHLTHIFRHNRRLESMDKLLKSEGTLLAAKARLIADEMMWPENQHNREYLRHLPRDEYDEFVWTVKDRDVAFGNFDKKEWGFVLGDIEKNALVPDEEKKPMTRGDYWREFKGNFYQFIGKGYEWDEWVEAERQRKEAEKPIVEPTEILTSSAFEEQIRRKLQNQIQG